AVCADDGTELVVSDADEVAAGDDGTSKQPDGDQIAYEFEEWDNQSRVLLDQLLSGESIVHVWEGATLVVRADDEERVDELVEQVEVSNQPTLDPDKEQVVFELEEWPDEKRTALTESLDEADIPFGFDENDDLVVLEDDEERVEAVLDQVDYNFSLDANEVSSDAEEGDDAAGGEDGDDGLAAQEVMSELFVTSDILKSDPDDSGAILRFTEAAGTVAGLSLPYGFAPGSWEEIVTLTGQLRALLDDADSEDEAVVDAAKGLRGVLRQYV
ncbi:MAG: hypothetical protein JO291_00390, partial [Acidimicrobiia bacterium]|nr:hypothetical protein [Acidimicrobiia bacterium]